MNFAGITVGISGYARSGKDTIGSILVEDFGFRQVSFAAPLKEAVYRLDPWIPTGKPVPERLQAIVDEIGWDEAKERHSEVRGLLQRMGTEVGRDLFDSNFWVNLTMKDIKEEGGNVVITDCRFPNEVEAIRKIGGRLWRVERPGTAPVNAHPSETALDNEKFNWTIINNGTIEDLRRMVKFRIGALI